MGLQQSKDELLYQQVSYGTTEGIKSLRNEGAGLEWMDKEGKTPLILASMNPQLYDVAKTLIELGANVNAYRPGRHAGTPLHHAAKRGLEPMVKLLLSNGANALVMNDDCQTALDVARLKGFSNVVRAIENHICLFSGWLQELYGPGFLEVFAPQLLSRKVWVVILPCGARKLTTPFKLELAIYSGLNEARPRTIIALWKANMDEPNFNQSDPAVIISSSNKSRVKLAAVNENEKQQLQRFCNACKGIPQVIHPSFPFNNQGSVVGGPAQTTPPEDTDLALAISASLQTASAAAPNTYAGSGASTSAGWTNPIAEKSETAAHNGMSHDVGSSSSTHNGKSHYHPHTETDTYSQIVPTAPIVPPSAPPVSDMVDDGPIHYPTIDMDLTEETRPATEKEKDNNNDSSSSSCVICLDAPVEGACIPCGHMAGCMSCLNEVKAKNWGCPVCRSKIDQVVRLYAV